MSQCLARSFSCRHCGHGIDNGHGSDDVLRSGIPALRARAGDPTITEVLFRKRTIPSALSVSGTLKMIAGDQRGSLPFCGPVREPFFVCALMRIPKKRWMCPTLLPRLSPNESCRSKKALPGFSGGEGRGGREGLDCGAILRAN